MPKQRDRRRRRHPGRVPADVVGVPVRDESEGCPARWVQREVEPGQVDVVAIREQLQTPYNQAKDATRLYRPGGARRKMSRMKKTWTQTRYKLPADHGWRAKPGYKIFVADPMRRVLH